MNGSILDNTEGHINSSLVTNEDANSSFVQNPYTLNGTGGRTIPTQNSMSPDMQKKQHEFENISQNYAPADNSYTSNKAKTTEKPHAKDDRKYFRDSNSGNMRQLAQKQNN